VEILDFFEFSIELIEDFELLLNRLFAFEEDLSPLPISFFIDFGVEFFDVVFKLKGQ